MCINNNVKRENKFLGHHYYHQFVMTIVVLITEKKKLRIADFHAKKIKKVCRKGFLRSSVLHL